MTVLERNQTVVLNAVDRQAIVVEVAWATCSVSADLYAFMLDEHHLVRAREHMLKRDSVSPDGAVVVRAGEQARQALVHLAGVDPRVRALRLVVATTQANAILESMTGIEVRLLAPDHSGVEATCEIGDAGITKCVVLGDLVRSPDGWEYHAAWELRSGGIDELARLLYAG